MQKRVLAIHDISCVGRCSMTVALPVLSACDVETVLLPTALLSAHTGIDGFSVLDLSAQMLIFAKHFKALKLGFDGIYTGYLANAAQIDAVLEIIDMLAGAGTKIFVDPVMGDGGKLYRGFGQTFPSAMRKLVQRADYTLPNVTEACLLTNSGFINEPDCEQIRDLLEKLSEECGGVPIISGVSGGGGFGAAFISENKLTFAVTKREPGDFPGTGDLFASGFVAKKLSGQDTESALAAAVNLVAASVRRTNEAGTDKKFGVLYEGGLINFASL